MMEHEQSLWAAVWATVAISNRLGRGGNCNRTRRLSTKYTTSSQTHQNTPIAMADLSSMDLEDIFGNFDDAVR